MNSAAARRLNKALEGQISAVEAYNIALSGMRYERSPRKELLEELLAEHKRACDVLRGVIAGLEAEPVDSSGRLGKVTCAIEKLAGKLSNKLAVESLKRGEQVGLSMYRWLLVGSDLPEKERALLKKQARAQRIHIGKLDALGFPDNQTRVEFFEH